MLEIGKHSGGINWVSKSKQYTRGDADVQVGVTTYKGKRLGSIIIRNNLYKKFDSDYVMFGIDGSRLYFKSCTKSEGYKMSETVSNYNRYIKASDATFSDWCSTHRGEYSLQYDIELGLNYIETDRTNKEA